MNYSTKYCLCGTSKTKVVPVIIGATGTVSKSFTKCMNSVTLKQETTELQKAAILHIHIPQIVTTITAKS
jgi:hypothetical protein